MVAVFFLLRKMRNDQQKLKAGGRRGGAVLCNTVALAVLLVTVAKVSFHERMTSFNDQRMHRTFSHFTQSNDFVDAETFFTKQSILLSHSTWSLKHTY
jgi:hypothetical protein